MGKHMGKVFIPQPTETRTMANGKTTERTDGENMCTKMAAHTRDNGHMTKSRVEALKLGLMVQSTRENSFVVVNTALAATSLALAWSMKASSITTRWMGMVVTNSLMGESMLASGGVATPVVVESWSGRISQDMK